ncbi:hypothetical protein DPMN_002941 [Dreissena polymorpha]|uniref:Uncharacterized protein n=1 Tax=Dreissena polymorpha TaxID=45954 RepID=A0A9D4MMX8_DREPO|nr:hypothetical protein DPMN_002941 [Dreissena polymorpha]
MYCRVPGCAGEGGGCGNSRSTGWSGACIPTRSSTTTCTGSAGKVCREPKDWSAIHALNPFTLCF